MDGDTKYTRINQINGYDRFVNIKGLVTYTSGTIPWNNVEGEGHRLCLDVADDSGEIRVFAWDKAAEIIGKISLNQFIQVKNVTVSPRNRRFNNLQHPFELKIVNGSGLASGNHRDIPIKEEPITFVQYDEVRNDEHPEFTYFSVQGKVVGIDPEWDGEGERGNSFTKQLITIEDEEGNQLDIASWNEYIPVSKDTYGKTLTVVRGKYIGGKYDELNSSYARVSIDDVRVR